MASVLRTLSACGAATSVALFLTVLAGGAAQAQQLIVNPDFESSPPPNFGNNIGWPIAPWVLGTGNQSNVVKVDGPGGFNYTTSGPESDASAPGAGIDQHYLDIASGSNDFYQAFTVPLCANGSATPDATYVTSGAFSTRDNLAGTGTIALREGTGPTGTLVPGSLNSDSLPANTTLTGGWSVVGSTVGLTAGQTYSFVVTMDNNVNFDNGTVTFQGLQCPAIQVNKSTTSTPRAAGDTLVYSFEVINISTPSALEVNNVTVTDLNCAATPTLVSATVTSDTTLQAGETQVYTCTSVPVTQAQVDARAVANTVIVDGVPTDGILVPATDTVTTPVLVDIVANTDDFTAAPIPGFIGGPAGNVLTNDELDGNTPVSGDVTIAVLANDGLTGVTIAADGTLNVPAGTPAGTYEVEYEICDVLNTGNCDSAIATVVVVGIEAVDDSFSPVAGTSGGTTPSVLDNDSLNGSPVVPAAVALTPGTAPTPAAGTITMDPVTGVINVAAGTTPGTYIYPYEICEIIGGLPSTNCSTAEATVVVATSSLPTFSCGSSFFEVISGQLSVLDPLTGTYNPIGPSGPTYNGIGFNANDNYIYGYGTQAPINSQIIRVGSNGAFEIVPTNTPINVTNNGVMGPSDNILYALINSGNDIRTINVVTGNVATISVSPSVGAIVDVVYIGGNLIGMRDQTLFIIDAATGNSRTAPVPGTNSGAYGAAWSTSDGDVYFSSNSSGQIFQITDPLGTPTVTQVTNAQISSNHDGANCFFGGSPILRPELTLTKSVTGVTDDGDGNTPDEGDTINYSLVVTNSGQIDLVNIAVIDPTASTLTGSPVTSLAIGASATLTATHVITLADLAAGGVENTATASGTTASGTPVSDTSDSGTDSDGNPVTNPEATETPNLAGGTDGNPTNDPTVFALTAITAEDDNLTGTPIDPVTGGDAGNVLNDNGNGPDTLGGVAITDPSLITIAVTDPDGLTGVTIGADGTLTVPPGSTPGAYQVVYEICEVANPTNCATAIATVVVGTGIVAENDDLTGTPIDPVAGGAAGNVLLDNGNGADTLNGVDITNPALITIAVTDPDGLTGVTIAADGTLTVPPGSTAGSYQVVYEICEVAAPANCATAIATVVVGTGILAQDDDLTGTPIDPVAGGVAGNVLAGNGNGSDTLNGVAITDPTLITIAVTDPDGLTGVTIGADGTLTVPPGSAPGSYQVVYEICEVAAPANCATAIATVVVGAGILAEDDDLTATPVAAGAGGIAGNVLTDNGNGADTLNGVDITNPALVTIAVTNPGGLTGVTIGTDGTLTVPPGTVPGTYSVEYEICEVAAPANCATATATVLVLDAGDPGLVDDTSSGNIPGTAVTLQVLTNDDDPANIFDPSTLTIVGTSGPGQPLVVPGQGTWTVDLAAGSITFTPEPGFTGNPTPISYQVTDIFGNLLAPAEVVVLYEFTAAFVCSDVIGKVFDDRNQDGRQDEGEPGIAGARLATVNGDIITTDEYGRYSVPCAAIPEDIGSTFLLKLDPRSLPTGYRLTTENPKTVRLTQGTMRRMNFGVTLSNVVRVDLTAEAFDAKGDISEDLDNGLKALVTSVAKKPSVVRLSYFVDGEDTELAKDRLDDVEDRLRDLWRGQGKFQLSLEKTVVERE